MRENNRDPNERNYCNLKTLVVLSPSNRLVPFFHLVLELGCLQRPVLYPFSGSLLLQFDPFATCRASISILVPRASVPRASSEDTQLCERLQP